MITRYEDLGGLARDYRVVSANSGERINKIAIFAGKPCGVAIGLLVEACNAKAVPCAAPASHSAFILQGEAHNVASARVVLWVVFGHGAAEA